LGIKKKNWRYIYIVDTVKWGCITWMASVPFQLVRFPDLTVCRFFLVARLSGKEVSALIGLFWSKSIGICNALNKWDKIYYLLILWLPILTTIEAVLTNIKAVWDGNQYWCLRVILNFCTYFGKIVYFSLTILMFIQNKITIIRNNKYHTMSEVGTF